MIATSTNLNKNWPSSLHFVGLNIFKKPKKRNFTNTIILKPANN